MGFTTLLLVALVGSISADDVTDINPFVELRSNLELLSDATNLDQPAYRLRDTVQPTDVFVDLDVYLAESRFNGLVRHVVQVTEAGLTQIVFHQKVQITAVSIVNSANQPIPLQNFNPFEVDEYYEIVKVNLANPIPAGTYTITVSFLGVINESPLDRGFYKGYYYLNNQIRYYATTQFQPFHARKAFPCFDEPQFKSRFVISITRDANLSPSYSNMAIAETQTLPNNRVKETFRPTPIVSVYLVAFHVSDFVETTSTGTPNKPFGIISRPGVTNQHAYAADIGLKITNELDAYLAFGYYDMGQGQPMKNDHIALPDFPSGAMENWGMVNYREAYLLYDDSNTNLINKIFIATIMAHELAHKWFGNLVTCFWWSNLWLNESFASFFEYFAAHSADPSLELDDQFVVDYVHSALNADSSPTINPMNWSAVASNPSISAHFGTSSYAKGASVLRTMEHFVGPTTFRNALRHYLRDNQYQLGTPELMYAAFETAVNEDSTFASSYPNIDVGSVFDSWVQNAGSPVLTVVNNVDTGVITITQNRFVLTGQPPNNPLWQVPVTWTHGGNPNFSSTKPAFVLTQRTQTIQKQPGHEYVILNIAQSGLYRVNYDDHNWELIAEALRNDRLSIHKLNRAQIVNDVLHFIRAGTISFSRGFDVLSFLAQETDYYPWAGALGQFDIIRRRLEHLPVAHREFSDYLLELMDAAINHLGYSENPGDSTSTILNRMQIMNYACNLGHEGCINYSRQRWNQYRQNENQLVNVNERRYVYCIGLREGNRSDYDFLYQKYNTSENTADMVVILRALACTKDQTAIQHYLEQSLFNDRIRIHDKTNAFSYALQGNKENLQTVLNFVYNRYNDIVVWYQGRDRLNTAINALTTYLTDIQDIRQFQAWVYNNQIALSTSFNTGVGVVNSAISNLQWGNSIAEEFITELRNRNSAAAIATPFALMFVALLAQYLR